MNRTVAAALVAALALAGPPARAQLVVHDPASYASLARQAQTALEQLQQLRAQVEETRRLHDGFRLASGAGALAPRLNAPELRSFVPEIDAWLAAARGDTAALGPIGRRADAIRAAARLHRAPAGGDLEGAGDRAARDAAMGEAAVAAGAGRLQELAGLAARLDSAGGARAVMDLQVRLAAEQAMIANDQMRLQGLAMAQDAEARLQVQRERERAAAAAAARLETLRRAFR